MDPKLKERIFQGGEALLYGVLAAIVAALADAVLDNPADVNYHHLWDVSRTAGAVAAAMYFKSKFRLPEAHADRIEDKPAAGLKGP